MQLQQIVLRNFRNYSELSLETDHPVNVFIGQNAQGKTNLLEAIYALALTKSHRTHNDKELIGWNGSSSTVYGEVNKKYGVSKLELTLAAQGKKAKVNGLEQRKLSEFIGSVNVVLFAPEDLNIVKGSPSVRRRFLDMEIGQVYPSYLHYLSQYQKILLQRNNVLKQFYSGKGASTGLLEVWNEQLAQAGTKIIQRRQHFIKKLQKWAEQIHSGITAGGEALTVSYKPSFEVQSFQEETVLIDQFMIKLSQVKEQELRRGTTLIGPHRDDLLFHINGKEVQTYGSQGQQRTTALSLKLAEIELISEEIGEYPLLLLDDVLSELDSNRQTQLIEIFQDKVQTFITTTGMESVHMDKLHGLAVYRVNQGSVTKG
jgi:DNA replication and repair protein RecF